MIQASNYPNKEDDELEQLIVEAKLRRAIFGEKADVDFKETPSGTTLVGSDDVASETPPPSPPAPPGHGDVGREKIKTRTALMILELASHTLILVLALGSLGLVHLVLEALLGHDPKFFNFIPISWIIDAADLLVIGKFLWEIIRDFRKERV